MMKKTLSVVALLLAVVMIAMCCVACGDDKDAAVVGKWTTEIEFDKYMDSMPGMGEEAGEMGDVLKETLSGVTVKLYVTLNEDGTALISADKDSAEAASDKIKNALTSALAAMGMPQEMIDSTASMFDISSMVDGQKGKYEVDGNKLYVYEEDGQKDDSRYLEFEVSSSELKITKVVGVDEQIPENLLPLVLTKVG